MVAVEASAETILRNVEVEAIPTCMIVVTCSKAVVTNSVAGVPLIVTTLTINDVTVGVVTITDVGVMTCCWINVVVLSMFEKDNVRMVCVDRDVLRVDCMLVADTDVVGISA
ncbi:hypothetical protein WICPIJ_006382 [Wickerhamomyces pijperi]|uniref:Uncharacterized protein n=1 Tax=Wickerhamomyces pijperi TaxID=599730 RepID=A0A9P8Q3U2_WICPI|nr:hypothetical protein WICPIJ_006382 [Wickerhamomyces pijperi]